jgi:hypothetical protein
LVLLTPYITAAPVGRASVILAQISRAHVLIEDGDFNLSECVRVAILKEKEAEREGVKHRKSRCEKLARLCMERSPASPLPSSFPSVF